jgi:hypothetical protein
MQQGRVKSFQAEMQAMTPATLQLGRNDKLRLNRACSSFEATYTDGREGLPTNGTERRQCLVLSATRKPLAPDLAWLSDDRMRWQIELVFKRLKCLAQLGHVPRHDDRSFRFWLYGKLPVTLLGQKLIRIGRDISPSGYALFARGTI